MEYDFQLCIFETGVAYRLVGLLLERFLDLHFCASEVVYWNTPKATLLNESCVLSIVIILHESP